MPAKKKTLSDSEKMAKLREIEERRQAIEAERLKKEQEMLALLAEQEALKSKLADVDDEEEEDGEGEDLESREEGELGSTTVESASVAASEPMSAPSKVEASSEPVSEAVSEPVSEPPLVSEESEPPATKPEPETTKIGLSVLEQKLVAYANRLFGNLYKERETKFFIVKSANRENLELAFDRNVWATTSVNEIRWNEAFMAHTNVLLIFSVQASGAFQGLARISAKSSKQLPAVDWTIPPNLTKEALCAVFQIDWISQQELPFDKVTHLRNTWNRNKLVKVARDGQEVNWKTGCALSLLFPLDGSSEYDQLLGKIKRKRSEIGPKQAVTSSSRSAKRRKNLNKPATIAIGINPSGYKRSFGAGRGGGPSNKRQRTDQVKMTGANVAPLGNQALTTGGVTNLFNLSG